jgi:hypothetical protein
MKYYYLSMQAGPMLQFKGPDEKHNWSASGLHSMYTYMIRNGK